MKEYIINLCSKNKGNRQEIDEIVYDLYGLTPEEREIVEESLK